MTTRRVKPGQPLHIKAAEYNAMLEAADAAAAGRFEGGKPRPVPETRSAGVIRIRNDSGAAVEIGQVLGIDGSFFDAVGTATERLEFARRPTMLGVEPTDDHAGRFAVAIEPITADDHGKAIAAGLVAAAVDITDADHNFAEAKTDGGVTNLVSGVFGSAQIIFRPDPEATGVQPCLVRLGNRTTSQARNIRGRVAEAFTCADATVTLDSIHPMDGESPGDEVAVVNFGFAGEEGVQARAIYNEPADQWELTWVPVDPVTSVYVGGSGGSGGSGGYGGSTGIYYKTMCEQTGVLVILATTECP
jgi:hypothetical protein